MFNFDNHHYYDILEVSNSATRKEITASFSRLVNECNPDGKSFQSHSLKQKAQKKFELINEAYQTLKNPIKRAEYDAFLDDPIQEIEADVDTKTKEEYCDNETNKIIINCPKCNQQLRVLSGKTLIVTCVSCGHDFEYPFKYQGRHTDAGSDSGHTSTFVKGYTSVKQFLVLMLKILVVTTSLSLISDLIEMQLLASEYISASQAQFNNARQRIIAIAHIIAFVITIITFAKWIYRSNTYVRILGARGMRFTSGWAVGWYFIPIACLWKPYQAMVELWKTSKNPINWKNPHRGAVLPWWWFLWITSMMLSRMYTATTTDGSSVSIGVSMLSGACDIALAVIAIKMVNQIFDMQRNWASAETSKTEDVEDKSWVSRKNLFIGIPLGILFLALVGYWGMLKWAPNNYNEQPEKTLTQNQDYDPVLGKLNPKEIFKLNNESVVLIRVYDENGDIVSFGSGVCTHPNGEIVTNYHVLNSNSFAFDIQFQKHGVYKDTYVAGISPNCEDYILLRVDGKDLPYVNISTRNEYDVGEKVTTIGNPEGFLNSVSEGIISGSDREYYGDAGYYQMTAPISQGSSGGGVFDEHGDLVGISTAISEEGQNLNLFLPIYEIDNNIELFDTCITIEKFNSLCEDRAKEYKKAGDQCLLSKDFNQANKNYEISLRYYDNDADTYYANSEAKYQLGLDDEALSDLISAATLYYLNGEKGKLLNVKRRAKEMSFSAEAVDKFDVQSIENMIEGYEKGYGSEKQFMSKDNSIEDLQPFRENSTADPLPLATEEPKKETELKKSEEDVEINNTVPSTQEDVGSLNTKSQDKNTDNITPDMLIVFKELGEPSSIEKDSLIERWNYGASYVEFKEGIFFRCYEPYGNGVLHKKLNTIR